MVSASDNKGSLQKVTRLRCGGCLYTHEQAVMTARAGWNDSEMKGGDVSWSSLESDDLIITWLVV